MSTPLPVVPEPVPVEPVAPVAPVDSTDWQKEAEKWKALSRKHENSEKALKDQIKGITDASMSDAEKALAEAREQGKAEALLGSRDALVVSEFKVQAAKAGTELPDDFTEALNLAKFVDSKGVVDATAVAKFVSTLGTGKPKFADPKDLGIGRNRAPGGVEQYDRSRLRDMSHAEVVKAREAGHLNDLLGITT